MICTLELSVLGVKIRAFGRGARKRLPFVISKVLFYYNISCRASKHDRTVIWRKTSLKFGFVG